MASPGLARRPRPGGHRQVADNEPFVCPVPTSRSFTASGARYTELYPDTAGIRDDGLFAMAITKDQRAAIGEAVMQLERDVYGRGPSSIRVSTSDTEPTMITVLSIDSLTAADRTLVERGSIGAVVAHHEAIHLATYDDFSDAITKILGRPPDAYFAQIDPHTGYAVRVFVFSDGEAQVT